MKYFHTQSKTSAKGDRWVLMCIENLEYLKISQTFEESIKREALIYRRNKQGIKGGEIEYSDAIQ